MDQHSIFRFVKHKGIHVTYTVGEDEGKSRLRPLSEKIDLDYVFSLHYQRKVKKDATISFGGERWKVGKFPKDKVTVCFIPGKKIMIFKDKQKLRE